MLAKKSLTLNFTNHFFSPWINPSFPMISLLTPENHLQTNKKEPTHSHTNTQSTFTLNRPNLISLWIWFDTTITNYIHAKQTKNRNMTHENANWRRIESIFIKQIIWNLNFSLIARHKKNHSLVLFICFSYFFGLCCYSN